MLNGVIPDNERPSGIVGQGQKTTAEEIGLRRGALKQKAKAVKILGMPPVSIALLTRGEQSREDRLILGFREIVWHVVKK
jgi:hypothetical protein